MKNIVECNHITKKYSHRTVLSDVSFYVEKGCITSIYGISGVGKSTLCKSIVGLISIDEGIIKFNGRNIKENIRQVRSKVQLVAQNSDSYFDPLFTIKNSLLEIAKVTKDKNVFKELRNLINLFNLPSDIINKYPSELSGGEIQRISIIRGILFNPELLILDESLSALDIINQNLVVKTLKLLVKTRHLSVLLISHDRTALQKLSDHLFLLTDKGSQKIK